MKRIIILLFILYFSAICIQQHTVAQPAPIPVPIPMGSYPVAPVQMTPVPGTTVQVAPLPMAPVPMSAVPVAPVPEGEYFRQDGIASWYGYQFEGRPTASGEIYNSSLLTAAHPTLPFGTMLLVTNRQNNRQVAVKVNDRGPFVGGRIIDVSRAAAEQLDMLITGTAPVTIDKIQANQYLQGANVPPQALQPPPGYSLPPGYPPGYVVSPGYVPLQQAPVAITQPTPLPQRLPPPPQMLLPPQQMLPPGAQTPVLVPTPPPLPPETVAPSSVTVQVYPPQSPSVIVADLPGPGPRARLNPSITPSPNKIYKLQVGSYKVAGNAVDAYVKLKAVGLEPSYERKDDLFRVVLAGIRGTDITTVTGKLGAAGFREAIIREER